VTDPRIEKWQGWIDGLIKSNVLTMHLHRYAWEEATGVISDNAELPDSYWWEFMFETYSITQAVAVRRVADERRDVASLGRLLKDLRRGAGAITRTYWIDTLWAPEHARRRLIAERQWEEHFAGAVGDHLDPAIPNRDGAALRAAADSVKRYVDENLAHTSADAVAARVTLRVSDVHDAMDIVAQLFKRYYALLTAKGFLERDPGPPRGLSRPVPPAVDAIGLREIS
jgi:hypothetical protein